MNKTIIININGIVFHIEEEAYEVLKSYMTDIKRHFAYSADSDEIVTDIENRLAEMFNEKLAAEGKQVIIQQDVEDVIAQMGSVSDIAGETGDSESETELKIEKKLYRDPDDRNIAGVCSGLAHYFEIEAKWVRVAFILSVLLPGTGLLIYAVLWIVVPEARTRQEKMAMRGEPITLQNFKKTFDEGNSGKTAFSKSGGGLSDFLNQVLNIIVALIKAVVKIIGLVIVFAGSMALFGLIIALLFSLGFWNNNEFSGFPFNVVNAEYRSPLYFSAFLLLIIPLIALISFAIRVIFNRKFISRTGAFAMLVLWLTGLGMGVFYASKIAADFKEDVRFEQRSELVSYPTFYLKLNSSKLLSKTDSLTLNIGNGSFKGNILIDDNDKEFSQFRRFDLYIEKSDDNKTTLTKEFKARGGNFEAALSAARKINYRFEQQDSVLVFDKYFYINENEPYRDQKINIVLKVPLNTHLKIDNNLDAHLHNYSIWECREKHKSRRLPTELIMTEEGLKCQSDSTIFENNEL